ncbi:uncharacterized protein BDR25DRAFT_345241 [Lindgomyces ingoldianus]|uniref:Uncharacterized protein n=1 Tax=Lindgomyces ingoldianus TaxID=673940 RepID=A0ACB6QJE7_9PLEO|nr:uncharacterized protein BDR25DRAFT_345241 [Lindgomyces ingoldianus]KAF2467079.1 hypothetical protein BDR25DRAFT_345241 [Lindgomyces ingoldianus]
MFGKANFLLAFVAVAKLVVATPPACLLGAINTYSTPSDISAVCKSKDITGTIAKFCGNDTKDALSAFADVCNKAGVKVSTDIPTTATGSVKPSGTGNASSIIVYTTTSFDSSCSCTKTAAITSQVAVGPTIGLATTTGSGSPSGTGTAGAPQGTGAAGKTRISAAALLAGLGVMAAAL